MTEGVFNCLIDNERTEIFGNAIKNVVKNGDIVVDMGTGTGILAMLAIDAGAKRAYAVEYDEKNIRVLEDNFRKNGYGDNIVVIFGDVTKVSLPEKVDVIIGEMIATGLIEELQIQATNNMLKYAKESTRVLLREFENYIDLVNNNNIFYGKKFDIIRYEFIPDENLVSEPVSNKAMYAKVDFTKGNYENMVNSSVDLIVLKDGLLNGIRISSKTIFDDGSQLEASPAYSYPIILPVNEINVYKGEIYAVGISYDMCQGFDSLRYSINKK